MICDDSDIDLRRLVGEDQSISVPKTVDCLQGKLYNSGENRDTLVDLVLFLSSNKAFRIILQEF